MHTTALDLGTLPAWLVAATDHIGRGTYEPPCTTAPDAVDMDHTATATHEEYP